MIGLLLRDSLRALLRIERKLDELLRAARMQNPTFVPSPLHSAGQICALCQRQVVYAPVLVDGEHLVVRHCGCTALPSEGLVQQEGGQENG